MNLLIPLVFFAEHRLACIFILKKADSMERRSVLKFALANLALWGGKKSVLASDNVESTAGKEAGKVLHQQQSCVFFPDAYGSS
jgi:hypothetical protein